MYLFWNWPENIFVNCCSRNSTWTKPSWLLFYFILFYFILYLRYHSFSNIYCLYLWGKKTNISSEDTADDVQRMQMMLSPSVFCHRPVWALWTVFYVYPVCLFTCIDHLVTRSCLLVLVYSCTWFCGDDKVCILQTQPGGNNDVAALLVHGDMFFVCLFFRLYFLTLKQRDWCFQGYKCPEDYSEMEWLKKTKTKKKQTEETTLSNHCYKHISSWALVICFSVD